MDLVRQERANLNGNVVSCRHYCAGMKLRLHLMWITPDDGVHSCFDNVRQLRRSILNAGHGLVRSTKRCVAFINLREYVSERPG